MNPSSISLFKYIFVKALFVIVTVGLVQQGARLLPLQQRDGYEVKAMQFYERHNDIEAITLGFSHMTAIDFDTMSLNGFHLYDSGGDYYHSLVKLQSVIGSLPRLRYVFLPVSESSLTRVLLDMPDKRTTRQRIYRNTPTFFEPLYLRYEPEEYFATFISYRAAGFMQPREAFIEEVRHYLEDSRAMTPERQCSVPFGAPPWHNGLIGGVEQNSYALSYDCILSVNGNRLQRLNDDVSRNDDVARSVEKNLIYIEQMIELLDAHGAELIIIKTPTIPSFRNGLTDKGSLSVLLDHEGISSHSTYINAESWFDEVWLAKGAQYFRDGNHLSREGARVFSARVEKILRPSEPVEREQLVPD